MLKDTFIFQGPLGEIECVVEPNRSENNAVLVMAHGFRGSRDSGGRAAGVAQQAAAHAAVVRFNFTGTQIISRQVEELRAVLAEVRRRQPGCKLFLLGRSLGGAASIITAAQDGALAGLILWATPNNLRFTFRYVMTEDEYRRLDSGETLHYDLPALLQKAQPLPVLLLHCSADEVVLAEQGQRNAAAVGEAAELHIFEGGDHSFTEYSDEAGALLSDWLGKRLKCGAC